MNSIPPPDQLSSFTTITKTPGFRGGRELSLGTYSNGFIDIYGIGPGNKLFRRVTACDSVFRVPCRMSIRDAERSVPLCPFRINRRGKLSGFDRTAAGKFRTRADAGNSASRLLNPATVIFYSVRFVGLSKNFKRDRRVSNFLVKFPWNFQ